MIKRWCRWLDEDGKSLCMLRGVCKQMKKHPSMRTALLPPADRHVCAISGEKPGRPGELALFALPKWKKKRGATMHTPWMTQHPLYCYLASFLTFFILCNIALASVKLAERYSRKRYLLTRTVGRKWKSASWTRTSLFVCLLRHWRKVDQMLGVYYALFGTGN